MQSKKVTKLSFCFDGDVILRSLVSYNCLHDIIHLPVRCYLFVTSYTFIYFTFIYFIFFDAFDVQKLFNISYLVSVAFEIMHALL